MTKENLVTAPVGTDLKGAQKILMQHKIEKLPEVDIRKYIDWTNGDFVFSDDRLEDVMNKLVLWYDCDVVYADEELKEIRLSGDMKRYGEVEEFLHFLKISTGAHFSVKNKTIAG